MYRSLGQFYPKKLRAKYKDTIICADMKINSDEFMGFLLFSSICLTLFATFMTARMLEISLALLFILEFIAVLLIVHFFSYILLVLKADAKGRIIEDILPDALQLMSSNLKAGLTTDKALLLSARPEFGPFANELNIVGKEITMGKEIGSALEEMTKRIRSEKLQKTIAIIISGLRSGGELAALLHQTAQHLRSQKFVEERVKSSVLMYVIFIFSAIGFGAPLLFALSSFLVETLTKSLGAINIPAETASAFPVMLSKVSITTDFVLTYVLISLTTTCILGSIVIGLVRKGREREGLRYIPILLPITIGVFFLIRMIISNFLGSTLL